MNNKLLLQDLIDQLSESGKLKKKDAEVFLRAFFKVIEDALFQGEVVNIKEIGSFKLLKVDARKSINISTGIEFEIKEHFKIAFTPDFTLKELVNKPFSHLDPVELDGLAENATVSTGEKKTETGNSFTKTIKSSNHELKRKPEEPEKKNGSHRKLIWIFFVLIIFILVVWAFISNNSARREYELKLKETEKFDSSRFDEIQPEEMAINIEDSLSLEAEIAAMVESITIAEKSVRPLQTDSQPPEIKTVKPNVQTTENAGVNTYGYKFPVIETMEQGGRLTMMSLKYYGHKAFWVYIYEANKNVITNPNNIPIGTKIRIPKPDLTKINPNDPNCIAKAKVLQTGILSK